MRGRVVILLLAASVGVHWPYGAAEFTFDDVDFVEVNASIRSLASAGEALLAPFPPDQPERALYRPLTNFSYALDYALWGEEARGYHATNVALYWVIVLLVHRLALRYRSSPDFAFAVALIYALHPVHTAAVDAVAGRSELLALGFGLGALLSYLRAVRSHQSGGRWLVGSLVLYAAACGSKETGSLLPAVLGLHVLLFHPPGDEDERVCRDRALRFLVPFGAVLVGYVALRFWVLGQLSPENTVLLGQPLEVRLLTMGAVFTEYLRLLVFPRTLQLDYYYQQTIGIPPEPSAQSMLGGVALVVFVCALAVLIARHLRGPSTLEDPDARPRRAVTIVSAAIFLIYLTPVLHVLDIGAVLAERFLLAPSLGFVLLLVLLGAEVLERLVSDARRRRTAAALGLAGLAVLGGWRSMERATEWRDNVRLWAATAAAVPGDARVHLNLGAAYFERGELEAAQGEFERSLELEPRNTMALGNLGALQLRRGEYAGALATYERMVGHDSANFIAWHNLGLAEAHLLRHSVAVGHYSRCLEINPNYVPAHTNLQESQRIIVKASRFIEANRADAETSPDPRLLEEMVNACTVVGDAPCAERFAAMAAKRGGAE